MKTPEIHRPRWHFPVFGTTIAIALDLFCVCVCVCGYVSYFLWGTFYDERRNPSLPSLPQIPSLLSSSSGWGRVGGGEAARNPNCLYEEEPKINIRGRNVHRVSNTSYIPLSLCGYHLVTFILSQGKGSVHGQS